MESRRGVVVASLNVGTMAGRGREVVDMMKRRRGKTYYVCKKRNGKEIKPEKRATGTNCTTPVKMGEGMA